MDEYGKLCTCSASNVKHNKELGKTGPGLKKNMKMDFGRY
jgi:hypothetical protein